MIIKVSSTGTKEKAKEPGLLRTCAMIWNETMPMFHGQNVFVCTSTDQLVTWATCVGPKAQEQIRDVRIGIGYNLLFKSQGVYRSLLREVESLKYQFDREYVRIPHGALKAYYIPRYPYSAITEHYIEARMRVGHGDHYCNAWNAKLELQHDRVIRPCNLVWKNQTTQQLIHPGDDGSDEEEEIAEACAK